MSLPKFPPLFPRVSSAYLFYCSHMVLAPVPCCRYVVGRLLLSIQSGYDSDQLGFLRSCQPRFLQHILTVLFVRQLVLPVVAARRTIQQARCLFHRIARAPFADVGPCTELQYSQSRLRGKAPDRL